jgi:hypothetical protein
MVELEAVGLVVVPVVLEGQQLLILPLMEREYLEELVPMVRLRLLDNFNLEERELLLFSEELLEEAMLPQQLTVVVVVPRG